MGGGGWGALAFGQATRALEHAQGSLSSRRAAPACLPAVGHSCCACCAGLQVLMSNMVALIWNTYMSYKSHA